MIEQIADNGQSFLDDGCSKTFSEVVMPARKVVTGSETSRLCKIAHCTRGTGHLKALVGVQDNNWKRVVWIYV